MGGSSAGEGRKALAFKVLVLLGLECAESRPKPVSDAGRFDRTQGEKILFHLSDDAVGWIFELSIRNPEPFCGKQTRVDKQIQKQNLVLIRVERFQILDQFIHFFRCC